MRIAAITREPSPGQARPRSRDAGPRALGRALEVLESLARRRDGATLSGLSQRLGSPKSSLLYLLRPMARLGYLVRSGDPDALDSIVPMAFGNLALDLILRKQYGRLVSIHRGFYDSVPITSVTSEKKVVDVKKYYNTERLRPIYEFDGAPLFIMTSD